MHASADQTELARLADDGCPNVPDVESNTPAHAPPVWSRAEGLRESRHRYAAPIARGSRVALEC